MLTSLKSDRGPKFKRIRIPLPESEDTFFENRLRTNYPGTPLWDQQPSGLDLAFGLQRRQALFHGRKHVEDIINGEVLKKASVQDWIQLAALLVYTIAIFTQWDNFDRHRQEKNLAARLTIRVMNIAILVSWLVLFCATFGIREIPGLSNLWDWLDTVKFVDPRNG